MYPPEQVFSVEELEIVFRIRQLIGDEKEVYVDDGTVGADIQSVASGTMYQLQEPLGWPQEVYVNDVEFTSSSNPSVVGYKYLKFSSGALTTGASLTVVYDHFRHSDLTVLNVYDTSAFTYLTGQCNLTVEELGVDLLVLAAAYILLQKDLNVYVKSAVELQDSDSRYDASSRPRYLSDLLDKIGKALTDALEQKTKCKMISLPVYKVE